MSGADEATRAAREPSSRAQGVDFDRTVRLHDSELRARVARACHCCPADAEEVAQETWLRAYERRHRFLNEAHLLAWVTLSARGLARDRARSWYGRQVTSVADVPDCQFADDAADAVVAREQGRGVLSALAALPLQQRRAIWAREVDGRSYAEIAGLLRLSEPAVRSLLHRAREGLRREYARRVGVTLAAIEVTTLRDRISRWVTGSGGPVGGAVATGAVAAVLAAGLAAPLVVGPPDSSARDVVTTSSDIESGTGPGSLVRLPDGPVVDPHLPSLPRLADPHQPGVDPVPGVCTWAGCVDPARPVRIVTAVTQRTAAVTDRVNEKIEDTTGQGGEGGSPEPGQPPQSVPTSARPPQPPTVRDVVPDVDVPGDPMPPGAPAGAATAAPPAPESVTAERDGTGTTNSPPVLATTTGVELG